MMREYLPILLFLAVAIVLGISFDPGSLRAAVASPDPEKVRAYECGF